MDWSCRRAVKHFSFVKVRKVATAVCCLCFVKGQVEWRGWLLFASHHEEDQCTVVVYGYCTLLRLTVDVFPRISCVHMQLPMGIFLIISSTHICMCQAQVDNMLVTNVSKGSWWVHGGWCGSRCPTHGECLDGNSEPKMDTHTYYHAYYKTIRLKSKFIQKVTHRTPYSLQNN